MHPSTLAKRGPLLLFLAVVVFYLYGLGQLPFVGPDEPRYAQVAREMLLRHDLITPTLGGHPWFEKPALLYWLMIASFKVFGVSEWAARLPSAISGLLTIAAVYCIARRVERADPSKTLRGYGFWCTTAAASTLGTVVFSRAASFDIVLTTTTTWALAFYVLYELEESARLRRACLVGFYAFIGLSLLAKGLVGIVIPLGVVGLYYLLRKRLPQRNAFISLGWGVPLALIVAASWYGPVIWKHGWLFVDQFFIQHHFARYVSNKYHHWRPVYFYLLVIPLLALPWTAFFVDGLLQKGWLPAWRTARASTQPDDGLRKLRMFALAWIVFPLLFFSLANSKLPGYILPMLPAAALIVGERFRSLAVEHGNRTWTITTTVALCFLFAIGALVYAWSVRDLPFGCTFLTEVPLVFAAGLGLHLRRKPQASILLFAGATFAFLIIALGCVAPGVAAGETSKYLLQLADARGYSQAAIYGMQRSDRTPEFYAAGRVVYGTDGEPVMYETPREVIGESQKRSTAVLTFVPLEQLNQLIETAPKQTDVIANNGRYAVVAVHPH